MTRASAQAGVLDMLEVGSTATLSTASGEVCRRMMAHLGRRMLHHEVESGHKTAACPLQELRGEVLALDEATGLLTLKQPGSTPFHSNLRILRIEHVQVSK